MSTTTVSPTYRAQILLPGQSCVAEGPHDQTGMYLMHHAFRRDLNRFVAAVAATPTSERDVWQALPARWARFAEILHHHHGVEDDHIWPVMLRHADETGSHADRETLEAMEAEHAVIDPALAACTAGFTHAAACPCETHRGLLLTALVDLRAALVRHLRHEETEALPLLQRTLTVSENHAVDVAAGKAYPPKLFPFLLPWIVDSLPSEADAALAEFAGRPMLLLARLFGRRYRRREAVAFRFAGDAGAAG